LVRALSAALTPKLLAWFGITMVNNNGSLNQRIRVKINPQLSKIHLSLLVKSNRVSDTLSVGRAT